jgi:hypothetical protein
MASRACGGDRRLDFLLQRLHCLPDLLGRIERQEQEVRGPEACIRKQPFDRFVARLASRDVDSATVADRQLDGARVAADPFRLGANGVDRGAADIFGATSAAATSYAPFSRTPTPRCQSCAGR